MPIIKKYPTQHTAKYSHSAVASSHSHQRKSIPMNPFPSVISTTIKPIVKPIMTLVIVGLTGVTAHAAILSESSERRVQVRQNNNTGYIVKAAPTVNNNIGITMFSRNNVGGGGDSMQGLIEQKQREFDFDAKVSIEEKKRVNTNNISPAYNTIYNTTYDPVYSTANTNYGDSNANYSNANNIAFTSWQNSDRYRAQQVASYQYYLNSQLGAKNVPPMAQLLTTARSWEKCGYEPYQIPPQELWSNIVTTLRLYSNLKNQGVLPRSTEIRSVYRSPGLNDCAGGAGGSKHMTAGAIDIWVPEYEANVWSLNNMQDGLCQFWQYQGKSYEFGLGLYATGAIHLDTQGYRKWGFNHASYGSSCRS